MTKNHLVLTLAIAVIAATLGFYGGSTYAKSSSNANGSPSFSRNGMPGNFQRGNRQGTGGGFLNGTILSKDDQSITLKLRDGGSKIVFYSSTTDVGKFMKGAAEDLQKDLTIMVNGKTNADGSVTATSIQIRPTDMLPPGAQQPNPTQK
jgi:hypothetical protein